MYGTIANPLHLKAYMHTIVPNQLHTCHHLHDKVLEVPESFLLTEWVDQRNHLCQSTKYLHIVIIIPLWQWLRCCSSLQAQQLTNGVCGSPESQPNSCQSSLNAGQTGYFGSTQSLHRSTMPSPPYTPYDQSPPQPSQQFVDPYLVGTSFQQYQGFNPDPMAPVSNGYGPQYSQQQQQQPGMYGNSSGLPQCPLPGQGVVQMPTQLDRCNVNPATLEMQATVFTTSPSSSTICYQPPNLTDLQFPSEQPQAFPGFDTMPSSSNGAMNASVANPVNRVYVNNARERYNVTCGAAPSSVHVGSKRQRENLSSQAPGISEWSSQWHQGSAPRAHVY